MRKNEKIIYAGNYLTYTEEVIHDHTFERVHMRDHVIVLPTRGEQILLIKEKRVHCGGAEWTLVSGWIDKEGKSVCAIAQEELAEEAGMEAASWHVFHKRNTKDMTISTCSTYFFAHGATDMENPPENPDHDEIVEKRWFTRESFEELLTSQEIAWEREALIVLMAFEALKKN